MTKEIPVFELNNNNILSIIDLRSIKEIIETKFDQSSEKNKKAKRIWIALSEEVVFSIINKKILIHSNDEKEKINKELIFKLKEETGFDIDYLRDHYYIRGNVKH